MKRVHSLSLVVLLMLFSILAMCTGLLLLLNLRYFTLGYVETTGRHSISVSGFQVWALQDLFVLLLFGLLPVIAIVAVWTLGLRRRIGGAAVAGLAVLGVLLCVLFLPMRSDLQIRYHTGPGQGYTIIRSERGDGLFELKRKGEFATHFDGARDTGQFYCTSNATLRIGALRIDRSFYPSLDRENHLALLEKHCRS